MQTSQPYGVSCKGGLNTNLNEFELLSTPGSASQLVNFEVDPDGGYRRINGYTPVTLDTASGSLYNSSLQEHFSGGQPESAIYLTIESISPTQIQVVVESATDTPVDLLVPEMTIPQYSETNGAVVTSNNGVFTLTYTFDTAPSQVTIANVVWSKQNFGGNWQLKPTPNELVLSFSSSPGKIASTPISGMQVYADGVIVATGTNLYFTINGEELIKINRAGVSSSGDNYAAFGARNLLARTNQDPEFIFFEDSTDYGKVIITDGFNKPYLFYMTGTGELDTRTFFAEEITVSGTIAPKVGTFHKRNFVCGGAPTEPNRLHYSGTTNFTTFTGGGFLDLDDQIVSIKSFRDDLIVFCTNSLYKVVNINDSTAIQTIPITKNVGCLSSKSVQEIGGDLVFLSPDGIRTVAGTARIGDVELSSVSRQVQSIFSRLTTDITDYKISSCVLRAKSQYRLFYHKPGDATRDTKGIIGTLTANGFEWSETRGIEATAITSGFDSSKVEVAYHGDDSGYIHFHDRGASFHQDGVPFNISARYKTPNFDFGDVGTRKTLDYVKISVTPEGVVQPTLDVSYDYGSTRVAQPPTYVLENIKAPGVFGTSRFTDPSQGVASHFGGAIDPIIEQPVSGSGETVNFTIKSDDINAPYSINGIYINYIPSSRR